MLKNSNTENSRISDTWRVLTENVKAVYSVKSPEYSGEGYRYPDGEDRMKEEEFQLCKTLCEKSGHNAFWRWIRQICCINGAGTEGRKQVSHDHSFRKRRYGVSLWKVAVSGAQMDEGADTTEM